MFSSVSLLRCVPRAFWPDPSVSGWTKKIFFVEARAVGIGFSRWVSLLCKYAEKFTEGTARLRGRSDWGFLWGDGALQCCPGLGSGVSWRKCLRERARVGGGCGGVELGGRWGSSWGCSAMEGEMRLNAGGGEGLGEGRRCGRRLPEMPPAPPPEAQRRLRNPPGLLSVRGRL